MKHTSLLLCLASCVVAGAQAASPSTPPAGMLACSEIADPGERVRCYDAQMAELKKAAAGAAPAAAPAAPSVPAAAPGATASTPAAPAAPAPVETRAAVAPAPVAPATAEARFGADSLPASAKPKKAVEPDDVMLSSITAMHQAAPKVFMISLANGQVWRQEGTQITMFFRAGYDVRIEKGLLGDYRMSSAQVGSKNWVKVTRVQ
jgi:hypothetical protein